ncbi:MAG: NUDIX hydrolase [Proteobacteria bacterium]|nr:NUDIX hydrolase [Pseudomonadota bacterium]
MPERRRTGVLCLHDGKLLAIELRDPASGSTFWSLPGGEIEANETIEECAIRETREETGYTVRLTGPALTNQYRFQWNGLDYDCTTYWFHAELRSPEAAPVDDADYLLRAVWLPWPGSRSLFDYHPAIVEAVSALADAD